MRKTRCECLRPRNEYEVSHETPWPLVYLRAATALRTSKPPIATGRFRAVGHVPSWSTKLSKRVQGSATRAAERVSLDEVPRLKERYQLSAFRQVAVGEHLSGGTD